MKKVRDERITKEEHKVVASVYPVILLLTVIGIIVKVVIDDELYLYGIDAAVIVLSLGYYVIANVMNETLFEKKVDEFTAATKNRIASNSFYICFTGLMVGSFVGLHVEDSLAIGMLYFAEVMIPTIYILIREVSGGLMATGTAKQRQRALLGLKITAISASIVYGIIAYATSPSREALFDKYLIVGQVTACVIYAIIFYFVGKFFITRSEKNANK